jgi:hypothetical protein
MALGSTQALTKVSSRDISPGGKGDRCLGLKTLPPSWAECLVILGASTSWSPKDLPRPIMGWLYLSAEGTMYCNFLQENQYTGHLEWNCGYVFDDSSSTSELRRNCCKLIGH